MPSRTPSLDTQALIAIAALVTAVLTGCGGGKQGTSAVQPAGPHPIEFRDVAAELGIDYKLGHGGRTPLTALETMGHGVAFVDYDGDERLDLILVGPDQNRLYRNTGERFEDVTASSGLDMPGYWIGIAAGDYDNDGDPDLCLSGHRCRALMRNEGGKRFTNVSAAAGIGKEAGWGTSAIFSDLDHDGLLDLFICRYVEFGPESQQFCDEEGVQVTCGPESYAPQHPVFFRNQGGGRFRDETQARGFDQSSGKALGAVPLDSGNGWTDLFVANDTEPGDFFRSQKGATFKNEAIAAGIAVGANGYPLAGMGVDAQDYDRDGLQDLVLTTFAEQPRSLWRNKGDGHFEERSSPSGLDAMRKLLSWGVGLVDFDNDGWLDLLFVNGHVIDSRPEPSHQYAQPLRLYRGGGGQFTDVSGGLTGNLQAPIVGRGCAFGDFDADGLVDVAISDLEGAFLLLRNTSRRTGHWLSVRLVGRRSNREGLGARVTVRSGEERWIAEAKTARSIYSASAPALHFGLGEADKVDEVTIRWTSGKVSTVRPSGVDQAITVKEP